MHVYLVAISKVPGRPALAGVGLGKVADVLPFPVAALDRWSSPSEDVSVVRWSATTGDRGLDRDPDLWEPGPDGLRALTGWIVEAGAPWALPSDLVRRLDSGTVEADGAYLGFSVDATGAGRVHRSLLGAASLYRAETDKAWFLSNRASAAAVAASGDQPPVDWNYHATLIGIGWPMGRRTAFAGVALIPAGSGVHFAPGMLTVKAAGRDVWMDETVPQALAADSKAAWDRMFEWLIALCDALMPILREGGARLSLSGGADSRLVLGLLKASGALDRIGSARITGAPYLPDRVVAERIARHYGLSYSGGSNAIAEDQTADLLAQHLFYTDAGISPWDMTSKTGTEVNGAVFFGHELATKNSDTEPGSEGLAAWAGRYYHSFDTMQVLRQHVVERARQDFAEWLERASAETKPENLTTRLRIETRGERWASVVIAFDSTRALALNPLMTDRVTRFMYSAGAGARQEFRLHYEMLMRADPWLVRTMPLAGKSWPSALGPVLEKAGITAPPPFTALAGDLPTLRASDLAFERHRDRLFDWLLSDRNHPLFEIVDPDRLDRIRNKPLEGRRRMAFWCLVQAKLAGDTRRWSSLAPWRNETPAWHDQLGLPSRRDTDAAAIDARERARLSENADLAARYGALVGTLRSAELEGMLPSSPPSGADRK